MNEKIKFLYEERSRLLDAVLANKKENEYSHSDWRH